MSRHMSDDILELDRAKHTNIWYPRSDYVGYNRYPAQDSSIVNNIVTLKYRNMYKVDMFQEDMGPVDEIEEDPHFVYEDNFRVIRCDIEEPYRMVSISIDNSIILVNDSRNYINEVVQYPIQYDEFIGIDIFNDYGDKFREGVTIRVDNGEPCHTVIIEFLTDEKIRVVLGDEVASHMSRYWYTIDVNGHTAPDSTLRTMDVDGGPTDYGTMSFTILDGGMANMMKRIYSRNLDNLNIQHLREQILEDKIPDVQEDIPMPK